MQEVPLGVAAAVQREVKGASIASAGGGGHDTAAMLAIYWATLALVLTRSLMVTAHGQLR